MSIGQGHDNLPGETGQSRRFRLRLPSRTTWLGGGLIALLLGVTAVYATIRYRAELTDSARELRTLDLLLAEETGRSLQSVSLILDSVADQFAAERPAGPDQFLALARTEAMHATLQSRVAGIPQLDAISIIGVDGKLINYSRGWPVPDIRISDRDYFQFLLSHQPEGAYITEPVINRGSGTPTVYLTRRVTAPDGTLLGLIMGAIQVDYFQKLYASLHLDRSDFVALWRSDGVLLARHPPATIGVRRPGQDLLADGAPWYGVDGVSEKTWSLDDQGPFPRVVASQPVAKFPVLIAVGRSKAAILRDWRREFTIVGIFVVIAIFCSISLMWALSRRFEAYRALAAAARDREQAVTAQREAEDALRQAQKMEAVGQLTGGVAHDFNNLLTVIGSSVELLRRARPDSERRLRYIDAIADATGRATKLTAQLLAFARRQTLQPQVFDAALNVAAVSQMVDRLTGPDIVVDRQLPGEPCLIDADPNQFDTAVLNLALNARDAMVNGGRLTIRVEATNRVPPQEGQPERIGQFVAVSVSDTGQGIPPDMRDRLFEPFFTTKKVGQGTGLGLSQVFGFAKQSGGEITVASAPGRGSTFTLHLPGTRAAVSPARPLDEAGPMPDGRGGRVLIVDDNTEVGKVAAQMLTELNYFSVYVSSAHDALDLLNDDDGFVAVFSDVVMPGMDGIALGRIIRKRHPGLPVLLTTGFSAALADSGSDEFPLLQKPYALVKLAQAMRDAIAAEAEAGPPAEPARIEQLFG